MGGVVSQVLQGVQVTGPLNVAARDVHNHYHRQESAGDASIPPILESVPNFRAIQIATLGRATPGTGFWIVECGTFRLWLDPDGWLRIMWGYGMPGAGKTIAASIVINALEVHASRSNSPVCVCYIYFRYSDHTKATTRSFLEVLVKQTLERHTGCLLRFNETYARHIREKTQPTEEELLSLLRQFTGSMITFYVLDALDEAPTRVQLELIEKLASLNVKLFITSRPLKPVEASFPNVHRFPIIAQGSDIDIHIDKEISRSADLREILEDGGPSLRSELAISIKEKCGGMFLHASLQLKALRECTSVHEVKETLAAFPADIEDLYLQTWQRILNQTPAKVLLAKKVILWVINSTRSLTIDELRHALATCPDTHRFNSSRLVQESVLIGLCRGLLMVEEETRLVRLVHYTAKAPLERLIVETFPLPHALLSVICLARLTDSGLQQAEFGTADRLEQALRETPLLHYAYESWFTHAHKSLNDPLTTSRLTEFVENCHGFPVRIPTELREFWMGRNSFDVLDPLQLVAFFNFPIVFAGSSSLQNPNQGTAKVGFTGLHLACVRGHCDVATELLHLPNILVNAVDNEGMTALILASRFGHEGITRLLLARPDIDVNIVDEDGWTALFWACRNGHKGPIALLLSHREIDVTTTDDISSTALIRASWKGHEEVVSLLLAHPDVDVNIANQYAETALALAAKGGWEGIVRLLLAHPSIHVGTREMEAARTTYFFWDEDPEEGTSEAHTRIVSLLEEFLNRT
ncbi:hypothetical protein BKA70DRAFT_175144 [Coprinopsis sp. MPI-PUGE-AT-0042]|nr:hypothetical protein BKA70DRAFT_175144 [Coprinopsis sp. MPI-PUGE-AT-0042]